MKSPTPETQCQSAFFKSNTLFVLLTSQIKYQGQANMAQPLKTLNN